MASWTNLVNATFIPGRPILGSTGLALRDNLAAFIEGAASAPKLWIGALERLVAGNTLRASLDTETPADTSVYLGVLQLGQIRVYAEHRAPGPGVTSTVAFVRHRASGSTTVATWSLTNNGTWTARSADVDVQPGDLIEIRHTISSGGAVRNRRILNGGESLWQGYFGSNGFNMYNYYA